MGSKRWSIVAASSLALVASQGPINVFATGTFIKPISQELGFGRGDIALRVRGEDWSEAEFLLSNLD